MYWALPQNSLPRCNLKTGGNLKSGCACGHCIGPNPRTWLVQTSRLVRIMSTNGGDSNVCISPSSELCIHDLVNGTSKLRRALRLKIGSVTPCPETWSRCKFQRGQNSSIRPRHSIMPSSCSIVVDLKSLTCLSLQPPRFYRVNKTFPVEPLPLRQVVFSRRGYVQLMNPATGGQKLRDAMDRE